MRVFILNIILPLWPEFRRFRKWFLGRLHPAPNWRELEAEELAGYRKELEEAETDIERELIQMLIDMTESSRWMNEDYEKNPKVWQYSNYEVYEYMQNYIDANEGYDIDLPWHVD